MSSDLSDEELKLATIVLFEQMQRGLLALYKEQKKYPPLVAYGMVMPVATTLHGVLTDLKIRQDTRAEAGDDILNQIIEKDGTGFDME